VTGVQTCALPISVFKRLSKDHKNRGSTSNHQIIVDAFNKHFISIPNMIRQNIKENYCLTETSQHNQNKHSYSLKDVFKNLFPSIKQRCSTNKDIENTMMSFKSSNSFGYDEVLTKLLK
jgi:hypothetical protein